MIRLFTEQCKAFLKRIESDEQIFVKAIADFKYHDAKCPECGAAGKLSPHGGYRRSLLSFEDGSPADQYIDPPRYLCGSCGTTHALLPDIIVPYSLYSLRFKLIVLIAYFERKKTVKEICEYYVIAVSTLYRWKGLLIDHKELMLGLLINREKDGLAFLKGLLEPPSLSERLQEFFMRYSFSFLQNRSASAARSRPP